MSGPVVIGTDLPAEDGPTVAWAEEEAELRGVELLLVHGCGEEDMRNAGADGLHAVRDRAQESLDELARTVRARRPALGVSTEVLDGTPRAVLGEAAETADLLVIGARGSGGFPGLLAGSTTLHTAATARCPVVVVHAADDAGHGAGEVVVGVDAREPGEAVLRFAFTAAERRKLPLRVVHAWRYPLLRMGKAAPPVYEEGHVEAEEQRLLAEVLAGWREEFPTVEVRPEVAKSGPAKKLVALSADAGLLVVGREGQPTGPIGRLGSVSQALVQHARCPVAVIPLG
jgi:nucleotide-binding universal stress UspA family protein